MLIAKKITSVLICSLFLGTISNTYAQINAITEKGDTIVVYENGTWERPKPIISVTEIISNIEVEKEKDEFSGEVKVQTKRCYNFGKSSTGYTISGYVFAKSSKPVLPVIYITYTGDLGCMSSFNSTMKVKLTSGDIVDFIQVTDTKCGDRESIGFIPCQKDDIKNKDQYMTRVNDNLKLLLSYDWETIRIEGTEYYTDLKPKSCRSIDKSEQFFRQHIQAIQKNISN